MNNFESFWLFLSGAPVGYVVSAGARPCRPFVGHLRFSGGLCPRRCAGAEFPLFATYRAVHARAARDAQRRDRVWLLSFAAFRPSSRLGFHRAAGSCGLRGLCRPRGGFVHADPAHRCQEESAYGRFRATPGAAALFPGLWGVLVVLAIVQIATKQPTNKAALGVPALPTVAVVVPS